MEAGPRKARLVGARALTYDTWEYTFAMTEPPAIRFRAGQFVSIACGVDAEGNPTRRSYSIASPATLHDHFVLAVKLIPDGLASQYFGRLPLGAEVEFTGPMGFFVLDLQHQGDVVFGATGTGLAPVIPMLDDLGSRPHERGQIRLYFGVRKLEDLFYLDKLEAFARAHPRFHYELCVTQPPESWSGGHRSRITPHLVTSVSQLDRPVYYLVGNGDMIKDVRKLLVERGVDRKKQIHTEAFFAATP
ncbi:MAG TPA: FAD-dependent oxidoreductase [Polyangia bacterium]|nr:FAD-dependent oxidoreductase [Polyangia bacterium]